jgi:hypothetical protein
MGRVVKYYHEPVVVEVSVVISQLSGTSYAIPLMTVFVVVFAKLMRLNTLRTASETYRPSQ